MFVIHRLEIALRAILIDWRRKHETEYVGNAALEPEYRRKIMATGICRGGDGLSDGVVY